MDVIVYASNSGFTKEYAMLLSEKTKLPAVDVNDRSARPPKDAKKQEAVFLGWLCAGSLKGLKKAKKSYNLRCAVCVGMAGMPGTQQSDNAAKASGLDIPFFYAQGGFDLERLHGIYHLMMKAMRRTAGKALEKKDNRTTEENDMLDLMKNGGSRVSAVNLQPVTEWLDAQK